MQLWWWRTTVCKLSMVLLSVMRVIKPLISSNPLDLVSEEDLGCDESEHTCSVCVVPIH